MAISAEAHKIRVGMTVSSIQILAPRAPDCAANAKRPVDDTVMPTRILCASAKSTKAIIATAIAATPTGQRDLRVIFILPAP